MSLIISENGKLENHIENSEQALHITTIDELRSAIYTPIFYSKRSLMLQLPGLSIEESFAVSERLNQYRNECGCSLGAKFMATACVLTAAWLLTQPDLVSFALLWRLPLTLVIVIMAAGFGKLTGIKIAHRQARREVEFLLNSLIN
jgi:hypothetical protein